MARGGGVGWVGGGVPPTVSALAFLASCSFLQRRYSIRRRYADSISTAARLYRCPSFIQGSSIPTPCHSNCLGIHHVFRTYFRERSAYLHVTFRPATSMNCSSMRRRPLFIFLYMLSTQSKPITAAASICFPRIPVVVCCNQISCAALHSHRYTVFWSKFVYPIAFRKHSANLEFHAASPLFAFPTWPRFRFGVRYRI